VSNRLWTRWDDEYEVAKRDWFANLAKRGDFPFLAISRMTLDEKSRDIADNWSDPKSIIF